MKKFFLLLPAFIIGFAVHAQRNAFPQEIAAGINGGVNFSKVSFLHNLPAMSGELGDIGMRAGMRGGLSIRYIAQKHFGVQLELNYMQSGWSEKFRPQNGVSVFVNDINFDGVNISRRTSYLEIPLLAHIYFGRKFRFFVNVGPKLGFLVSYQGLKQNLTEEQLSVFEPTDPRIYDEGHNTVDYGLSVGGGFDFNIGGIHTTLEGRYTFGFADLYSSSKTDIYQRSNNQNVAVILSVFLPVKTFYR